MNAHAADADSKKYRKITIQTWKSWTTQRYELQTDIRVGLNLCILKTETVACNIPCCMDPDFIRPNHKLKVQRHHGVNSSAEFTDNSSIFATPKLLNCLCRQEALLPLVLSWCTLWHFSGENLLMANQPIVRNWPRKLPNWAK